MLPSSGDSFPHLIKKRRLQLGFVTYLLNYLRIIKFIQPNHSNVYHHQFCIKFQKESQKLYITHDMEGFHMLQEYGVWWV